MEKISVRGAREHNLRNVDVEMPRNSLTVITEGSVNVFAVGMNVVSYKAALSP